MAVSDTLRFPSARIFLMVMVFSLFVNLLMLTGPLYMLQVYDRVLSSRSIDTLLALSGLMVLLFAFMGIFDYIRGRILARHGLGWSSVSKDLSRAQGLGVDEASKMLRAGDVMARAFAHPGMAGLMDMVWVPLFIVALWMLHPFIALATVAGLFVSVFVAILGWVLSRSREKEMEQAMGKTQMFERKLVSDVSVLRAFGVWGERRAQWASVKDVGDASALSYQDRSMGWSSVLKTFRLIFQSAILGLGAYLAVTGVLSPGAMIAGSILAGRALAPVDQVLGGLPLLWKAREERKKLIESLEKVGEQPEAMTLETVEGVLEVSSVGVQESGSKPLLSGVSVAVRPGTCLGLFGECGSGKSILAKIMTGLWSPSVGSAMLDGILLHQIKERSRASFVRYVDDSTNLPSGRVLDIVRGFDDSISEQDVLEVTRSLGIHQSIVKLPNGYDERIEDGGLKISGSLRRALLLARAFVGAPSVIVLDMPELYLEADVLGAVMERLDGHVKAGGCAVLISSDLDVLRLVTHVLVLEQGRVAALGEILKVVDRYIQALKEGTAGLRVPSALKPAISRRMRSLEGGSDV